MSDPEKQAANDVTGPTKAQTSAPEPTPTTTPTGDPMAPYLAHAGALLQLGPADALRVVAVMTEAIAAKARAQGGHNAEEADAWAASSQSIAALATSLGDASTATPAADEDPSEDDEEAMDHDDDDAAEDGDEETDRDDGDAPEVVTASATPPRKARTKMRSVAGLFEVTARVESCRLREVNEMGERGEFVGRLNEQGIEQTEWPIGLMTAERLRQLTKRRGGKYIFEWLGRNEKGARVALGRSRAFKVQGEKAKRSEAAAVPSAASAPATASFDQFFAMQRYHDERRDLEEARRDRERAQQLEIQKLRERLASRERMQKTELQARVAKAQAAAAQVQEEDGPRLNEAAVAAFIEQKVTEKLAHVTSAPLATKNAADELQIPRWLQQLGLDEEMINMAKPFIKSQLANLPATLAAKAAAGAAPVAIATPTSPYPNVKHIVPKGGGG